MQKEGEKSLSQQWVASQGFEGALNPLDCTVFTQLQHGIGLYASGEEPVLFVTQLQCT